jgi:hypothetical protein
MGRVPNPRATLALGVFFLAVNLANAVYTAHRVRPSAAFAVMYYGGTALLVGYWILADARRLGIPRTVDVGWFVVSGWPLALPYHLVKTRGAKGGVALLGLIGLFALTYVLSLLVFFALKAMSLGR